MRGLAPPQMIVMNLNIKEMHSKNVAHWAHALYKKILNTFKLLNCTSLPRRLQLPIPISVCEELLLEHDDNNTAAVAPMQNYGRVENGKMDVWCEVTR